MTDDPISAFADMMRGGMEKSKEGVERRARAERRSQLAGRERAVRTTQINFRCSPAWKAKVATMAKARGMSIADLLEAATAALEKQQ